MIQKTVIMNRAVPGSGKTTISNCIVESLKAKNLNIAMYSTDEYFMTTKGTYEFDVKKLYEYHIENLSRFKKSLELNTDIVICDNTNIAPWQTKAYTELARKYQYKIIFITFDPREIEKHVASQVVTKEKPDAHEVSEKVLIRMIDEYHLYDNLLDETENVDPSTQFDYTWNIAKYKKELNGKASSYFDLDDYIRILPNEYQKMQEIIGEILVKKISVSQGK